MTILRTLGWFDLQVNGYQGLDYNAADLSVQAVTSIARLLATQGVAHHLPTLITGPRTRVLAAARTIRDARANGVRAHIPGIHLEGPFINPADGPRGAHPVQDCRRPDMNLIDELQEMSDGAISLVTLAPELPGAMELIRQLRHQGITVAIGHSDADSECLAEAIATGAQLITHYGNGIHAMLPRHPNLLWSALVEDVHLSLILDGHHLPASVAEVAHRMKTSRGISLISDAVQLAGLPAGVYRTTVGEQVELRIDGRLELVGTPYLAGSSISLLDAVTYAVNQLRWQQEDVMAMVTTSPRSLVEITSHSVTTLSMTEEQVSVLSVEIDGHFTFTKDNYA